jgi:hypothetical protein
MTLYTANERNGMLRMIFVAAAIWLIAHIF